MPPVDSGTGHHRFLSTQVYDQGETKTCSFHASMVAIESLINAQRKATGAKALALSVCETMRLYAGKTDIFSMITEPITFLMHMRHQRVVPLRGRTVAEEFRAFNEQKTSGTTCARSTAPPLSEVSMKSITASAKAITEEKSDIREVPETIPVPNYNIQATDLTDRDTPSEVIKGFKNHFSKKDSQPIIMSSCIQDETPGICTTSHAIALIGIKESKCRASGKVRTVYTGIVKNSYGDLEEEYHLEKMLTGMIRHRFHYLTLQSCCETGVCMRSGNCLDPPLAIHNRLSPLYHLAMAGDASGISKLQPRRLDPNARGTENHTPLYIAADQGNAEVVHALLQYENIDPNAISPLDHQTALYQAAGKGHTGVVRALLRHKRINPSSKSDLTKGQTPLYIAAAKGRHEVVREFRSSVSPAEATNALSIAAQEGKTETVQELLTFKDIDPNELIDDVTPLFLACQNGHMGVVQALLGFKGTDPNRASSTGETPLVIAISRGHTEVVELLLQKGARANDGPWDLIALAKGNSRIVELIRAARELR